jgi:hypothetical protein
MVAVAAGRVEIVSSYLWRNSGSSRAEAICTHDPIVPRHLALVFPRHFLYPHPREEAVLVPNDNLVEAYEARIAALERLVGNTATISAS